MCSICTLKAEPACVGVTRILANQKRIGTIIEERTALTGAKIKPLFREARTKDAAYALDAGIIDQIKDVDIPAGVPVVSLVFQR